MSEFGSFDKSRPGLPDAVDEQEILRRAWGKRLRSR